MKARIIVALLFCLATAMAGAQTRVPEELAEGLRAFQNSDFESALGYFQQARGRSDIPAWRGHALFWTARTQMALARYAAAADTFDSLLDQFDAHPYREEAAYQRARLFHLQEQHQAAVQRFSDFVEEYSESEFYANALYWSGEALFSLGRLDAAERMFAEVAEQHPSSFRAEAARYRMDIIELTRRENELLTLLQWSHEEYLSALDTFQAREREYEEALASYRERLAGLATEDFRREIEALNVRIAELETSLAERETRINELLADLRRAQTSSATEAAPAAPESGRPEQAAEAEYGADLELREALLSLKARALELQGLLLQEGEAGE